MKNWKKKAAGGVSAGLTFVFLSGSHAGAQVEATPTTDGLPGAGVMQDVVNWGAQVALFASLGAILAGGALYGWSYFQGRTNGAHRGQMLLMGGGVGALVTGIAPVMINTLFNAGVAGA